MPMYSYSYYDNYEREEEIDFGIVAKGIYPTARKSRKEMSDLYDIFYSRSYREEVDELLNSWQLC